MIIRYLFLVSFFGLSACSTIQTYPRGLSFGKTYAEQRAGFTYVPIEPLKVDITSSDIGTRKLTKNDILYALPDNSVRIASRKISGFGTTDIGTIGVNTGYAGNSYEVIIDYVTTETVNVRFKGYWQSFDTNKFGEIILRDNKKKSFYQRPINTKASGECTPENKEGCGTTWKLIITAIEHPNKEDEYIYLENNPVTVVEETPFNIPVYIGLGLRIKANVTIIEGSIDFTGLGAITTAVEKGEASGSISVQTIGVTGPAPRMNLKMINEITENTVIDQIQTLASVKTAIEGSDTIISPRVVGFHNTAGMDTHGINIVHGLLAQHKISLNIDEAYSANGTTD